MEQGYEMKVEGGKLIVTVDLTSEIGVSASGKNMLIASTRGAVAIPGSNAKLNFSVYKKA